MRSIIQTFVKPDGTRKVEVFQHTDKTFGFEEWCFGEEEKAWYPCGRYSEAHVDTLENVIKEARGRVSWLLDEI